MDFTSRIMRPFGIDNVRIDDKGDRWYAGVQQWSNVTPGRGKRSRAERRTMFGHHIRRVFTETGFVDLWVDSIVPTYLISWRRLKIRFVTFVIRIAASTALLDGEILVVTALKPTNL